MCHAYGPSLSFLDRRPPRLNLTIFVFETLTFSKLGVRSLANASRARQFNPLNPPGVGWVPLPQTNTAAAVCRARSCVRSRSCVVVRGRSCVVVRGRALSVMRSRAWSCVVVRGRSCARGRSFVFVRDRPRSCCAARFAASTAVARTNERTNI